MVLNRSPIPSIRRIFKNQAITEPSPTFQVAVVEYLPTAVILEIGRQLAQRDVLYLSLCSRRLRTVLTPVLYSTMELSTNGQCKTALISLSKRPELAVHVRRLVVRPNCLEWTAPGEEIDENLISNLITKMACWLRGLEAFVWDGLEMPNDEIWSALRTSCKHLKRLSTTIGEDPLNPTSALFDFDDLRQLSLTVKCDSLEWLTEGTPKIEKLPRRFWAMLIERCPRLEELALGGPAPSPRVFDIRHVTSGRWSRLRTLILGDSMLISSAQGDQQSRKDWDGFMGFLAWHRTLRSMHLRHAPGSIHFPSGFALPSTALPHLETFSGPLKFVKTLPHPKQLQHLTLTYLHYTPSSFPPTFAALRELPLLSSLCIWIDLSFGLGGRMSPKMGLGHHNPQQFEDAHAFQGLLSACGDGLENLEVMCFTRPTFAIKDFSLALNMAPQLRSFVLTKVYKSNDEDLSRCASRIITDNPNLRRFTIRQTHDSWYSQFGGRMKQCAMFEVLRPNPPREPHDLTASLNSTRDVITLLGKEWGRGGLTGKEYSRHFLHTVSNSKDTNTIKCREWRRSRRRSELSTTPSSGSGGGWSWKSVGGRCVSPRSSISSEKVCGEV